MSAPAVPVVPPPERDAPARRRPYRPGLTVADLSERFGPIPASRILGDPPPGEATVADWEAANRRGRGLYELIDGTLIEKAVSDLSSSIGLTIGALLWNFVTPRRLGHLHGADGFFNLPDGLRAPDVSFTPAADRPDGLQARGFSDVPPALVVEVLSPGNTAQEMRRKRAVYFAAGVVRVWEVDPETRTATVWRGPDDSATFRHGDALPGEPVLPGLQLKLSDLFPAG
ncbi:Uma2 family endonuclease [Alienimonas californiensis]|uniref:Putative restriction endonuclease domain-containing protein n=1 Tax=Alienimonas californiensis TaxID=2527989 RepID=A0A517P8T5_9PLAN|nr:Uma2 family endonuclease [Alienimonas californiensis]QDT15788.1 hypothetical protein CA12_18820 [Alienimonas californiensis]